MASSGGQVEYPLSRRQLDLIVSLAQRYRLSTMYPIGNYARQEGGLMTYASRESETQRRAADYVDRILRGARPADLPIEQPMRYDLIVNMRTARALGLTFPPAFLARWMR
jgi:putative ABC transport system substrate-binding protein